MIHACSLLKCWTSGKSSGEVTTAGQSKAAMSPHGASDLPRNARLYGALPHFYHETLAYLNGDVEVLHKLPAVQASALRKAGETTSPAVLQGERYRSQPQDRAGTPRLPPLVYRPAFLEMVQREIPLAVTPRASRCGSTEERSRNNSLLNDTSSTIQSLPCVYDGLRSSPPFRFSNPHIFKVHTISSSNSSHLTETKQLEDNQDNTADPSADYTSTPKLELATFAVRTTPKLITHRLHRTKHPYPPSSSPRPQTPSHPSTRLPPSPAPTTIPPPSSPLHHPLPSNPHYTSPHATALLTALLDSYLPPHHELNKPPPSAGTILASLLLQRPSLRRTLPQRNPALARQINALDWRGAERELPEGSFARRAVEGWVYAYGCGGGGGEGEGVFGEWEWPWEEGQGEGEGGRSGWAMGWSGCEGGS